MQAPEERLEQAPWLSHGGALSASPPSALWPSAFFVVCLYQVEKVSF